LPDLLEVVRVMAGIAGWESNSTSEPRFLLQFGQNEPRKREKTDTAARME